MCVWVVKATLRPIYPREREPVTHFRGGLVGPTVGLDGCLKSRHYRDSIPGTTELVPANR
jgi:hypothetical protein